MKIRHITIAASLIGAALFISPQPAKGQEPSSYDTASTAWDRIEQDRTALEQSVAEAEIAVETLIADTRRHADLLVTLEQLEDARIKHVAFTSEQEAEARAWAEAERGFLTIRSLSLLRIGPDQAIAYLEDVNRALRGDEQVEELIRAYKQGPLLFIEGSGYRIPPDPTLRDLETTGLIVLRNVHDRLLLTHDETSFYVTEEGIEQDGELVSTQTFSPDHIDVDHLMTLFGYQNVEGRYWKTDNWINTSIDPEAIIERAYAHHLKEENQ